MDSYVSWDDLPTELLEVIGHKVGSCEDFIRFSAVCRSWQAVAFRMRQDGLTFLLSPESPLLLLAEELPEGSTRCCDINVDEDGLEEEEEEEPNDDEDVEDEDEEENEDEEGEEEAEEEGEEEADQDEEGEEEEDDEDGDFEDMDVEEGHDDDDHDQLIAAVGSVRGLYRLSTRETRTIDLPEAAGKLILGANKGWVLTLGSDFRTKLLHPLFRHQILLPSLSKCSKVALSSRVLDPSQINVPGNDAPQATILVICGELGCLGFARVGDQKWRKVQSPSVGPFVDITYHMGKFYAINHGGAIFACNIDDGHTRGATGAPIALCPFFPANFGSMYLVDSENDLWYVARIRRVKYFKPPNNMRVKYRTTNFLVWRLEPTVSDDGHEKFDTWVRKHDLGGKAFFVGLNASVSLSPSSCVRPNCIYFTDDISDLYYPDGGGHDMGIFDVERGTIEPHFQGKSIHPISPPLWYI